MSGVIDTITGKSGKDAARASERAAGITAEGQREQLDYLKEVEALPLSIRNQFMPQLADIFSGGDGQRQLLNQAKNSPLYTGMIDNINLGAKYGEDAILRNASATGGLRSGTANESLARLADERQMNKNNALTMAYGDQLQGIQGLAGVGLNTNAIGSATAAPSATVGQGIVAGANAIQQSNQALTNNLFGLGGMALMSPAGTFSDIRLKDNIKHIGERNGHQIFSWTWKDNDIGLSGEAEGVMAHLVYEYMPEAVSTDDGLLLVDYNKLGLTH